MHPAIQQCGRCYGFWRRRDISLTKKDGPRYIYQPTQPRHQAGQSALKQIVQTFFDKSIEKTVAALVSDEEVSDEELDRLSQLIEQAKKGGPPP